MKSMRKEIAEILGYREEWIRAVQIQTGSMVQARDAADAYDKSMTKLISLFDSTLKALLGEKTHEGYCEINDTDNLRPQCDCDADERNAWRDEILKKWSEMK